jgi:hypothetical protein
VYEKETRYGPYGRIGVPVSDLVGSCLPDDYGDPFTKKKIWTMNLVVARLIEHSKAARLLSRSSLGLENLFLVYVERVKESLNKSITAFQN